MFETLILSFKLRITYMANNFIYSMKQFPLIGKEISDKAYSSKGFKRFAYIMAILFNLFWDIFLKKTLYILIMGGALPTIIYVIKTGADELSTFPILTVISILTIIGGIDNNYFIDTSQDKDYAMFIMKVNAKNYIIGNYIVYLSKVFLGMFIALSLFTVEDDLLKINRVFLPLYIICIKMFFSGVEIKHFKRKRTLINDKIYNWIKNILCIGLFIIAYTMFALNINITNNIFFVILGISVILGGIGLVEILKFDEYKRAYKVLTLEYKNFFDKNEMNKLAKEQTLNTIDTKVKFESKKEGYEFFNEIFVKRHRGILEKTAKFESILILLVVIIIGIIIFVIKDTEMTSNINNFLLNSLPYFTFIMFLLNRGPDVTKAMYMNCDHSMLTYKFFKRPEAIVGLFKERLKTLVKVNLVPSTIMAIALPVLLYISGGTDNYFNYIILFVSVIAMSIFFSTHYLIIYYLLQPYNTESELNGASYKVMQVITYMVCYVFMDLKLNTFTFGLASIVFCITYIAIALALVFKFAPKTFKIRK